MHITLFKKLNPFHLFSKKDASLYSNFNLYLKNDKKMALSMIEHGFQPNGFQQKKLQHLLSKEACISPNFFYDYQSYLSLIHDTAFVNFFVYQYLGTKCKNNKTTYDNFSLHFKSLDKRVALYERVKSQLLKTIQETAKKASKFSPKYHYLHQFDFNQKQKKIYKRFTNSIYNTLVLLPLLAKNFNDFTEIKCVLENSVNKINQYVTTVNNKANTTYYARSNNYAFQITTLSKWMEYLNRYNITTLKNDFLEKTKELSLVKSNVKHIKKSCLFTEKLLSLQPQLDLDTTQKISSIIQLYEQINSETSQVIYISEVESLYKDTVDTINKFLTINPIYRKTLTNTEGHNPEIIMASSLELIHKKLDTFIAQINHDKLTELSVQQRKIQMKV